VAGNEPAAGKMPRPNRVRKPPGPHRLNILTAPSRGSKKPRRSGAKELLEKAPVIILSGFLGAKQLDQVEQA